MKKWKLSLAVFAAIWLALSAGTVHARENGIVLNDKHTPMGSSQIIVAGATWVPLKELADSMGYALSWNQKTATAKLVRPGSEVIFTAKSKMVKMNDSTATIAKAPNILKGKVYVPLVSSVSILGGKTWTDKSSGNIMLADEPRFTLSAIQGRTYWVSQKSGEIFLSASSGSKPESIGKFPLGETPYSFWLQIKSAGNGSDLLLLIDKHYAMFNDFSNGYQALIKNGKVLKQMDYHYIIVTYPHAAEIPTKQLYMTDGKNVQYINADGSLGKLFELEKTTGRTGDFTVEYAAEDIALVRNLEHTELFAVHTRSGETTNLSAKLISSADRKDWDTADGRDTYVVTKMLVLKKREGNVLTFNYTGMMDGKVHQVVYTITK
ncbi:copper amine oxidase N-terminal domain-containing protein [Paenibacillus graminis]|uniref:copper amine oxidase N-terminal domain-containing protein n=1 Tax=Paenibacillus graminis TaxID=189425 RepID=UPI002DB73315|nr:copper amine oxidase N-terminal domain-containing protein [Paenibacillus graminis]MEC0167002.1 copper amine oxidase N-terminal domain-containing protein [Paenibacillus graminis]